MTDETSIPNMSNDDAERAERFLRYRQKEAEDRIAAKKKLQEILGFLREHQVVSFGMVYSGQSDSGCVDTASLYDRTFSVDDLSEVEYEEVDGEKEKEIQKALINRMSQSLLDDLADILMDLLVPQGYEINDGGQGVIVLNVASGEVIGEHGSNYTHTDITSLEINLDTEASDEV
jgi:hypothetical protein